jgi:hypothetical protein
MQTVYELAAKNAILYPTARATVGQNGIALRDREGHVFFRADRTDIWTDITAIEPGCIQFCGDVALELAAKLVDGDLVLKASRTVQKQVA